uniref:Uncharacterized protein n=1 Tax=Vibrio genomosp. F6 TaxID=723172 RepID=A0A0H3ZTM6_9VIBR|nr:hypothetical protein [Vibrio genomosp. F6]
MINFTPDFTNKTDVENNFTRWMGSDALFLFTTAHELENRTIQI